jgi:hypothetical protein
MSEQSVIGVYNTELEAEGAIESLDKGGFPIAQVSIVAQNLQSERTVHGYVTVGDMARTGARDAAWFGGFFGMFLGAAFLWVPGFGPLLAAGPFVGMLLGGIEGAIAGAAGGGLLGAMVGLGVSKQHVLKYEENIKSGKFLVIVHGTQDELTRAHTIMQTTGAAELTHHGADAA